MTQVVIENQFLDITEDISALLTFAIDDVKEFATRNTTFSKTIVLPGTARNNKAFGHVFDVRNSNPYDSTTANVNVNFNPAKRARAYIFQDQIQTFKGWLRLMEIRIDGGAIEYEVAVFGELYGFIAALGKNKLEDLDFSSYDNTWNGTNVINSWTAPVGSGVVYPLIDYGGYSTLKHNWDFGTFRPALFVKDYIDKIFAAAGYTYDCVLFNTDRFKRLIVPHNQKTLTSLTTQAASASKTITQQIDDGTGSAPITTITYQTISAGNFTHLAGVFTWTGIATTFNVVFTGRIFAAGPMQDSITARVVVNGTPVSGAFQVIPTNTDGFFDVSLSTTVTLQTNDTIAIETASGTNVNVVVDMDAANFDIATPTAQTTPISLGDTITINDTVPRNILQKDFFASIIKLFNLYVIEDTTKANGLKIQPFVDFYTTEELDWTGKLDRSKPIRLTPMSNVNARFFDFKFKDDSDYYNETYKKKWGQMYGDYSFDSEFDFENERAACEVIFSPTPLVGYDGEDKVYSTILKLENNIEQTTNSNIRILQFANVTGVTSWNINGVSSGLTNYGYAGHYDNPDAPSNDIHFGVPNELYFTLTTGNLSNQQFNLYWSEYMAEITDKDSKLLTATFKLDVLDIINLDFGKLIWIDGALWRLNKIEDYNMSNPDLCTVSLLKVIEKVY